ncbi:MAG: helix-turn-helix domain containing protein, partial [Proteobacteria bacterium]|nr:helix-turn-helix domain containing protein [Pseudomonadota bacterium]
MSIFIDFIDNIYMSQMGNIAERLLESVSLHADGKHTVFAKKAGIPHGTFSAYIKGRMPHAEHLCRIQDTYNVNINWVLTGKGEKYIREEDSREYSAYYEEVNLDDNPEMMDLLVITKEVLQSDTGYTESLAAIIRSFQRAVTTEKRLNKIEGEVAE